LHELCYIFIDTSVVIVKMSSPLLSNKGTAIH